jgi:protein O-GlcNAc transferase
MNEPTQRMLEEAIAAQVRGAFEDAKRLYRRVLKIHSRNAIAWGNLAIIAAQEGNVAEAEKLFRVALDGNPGYAQGYNNFGHLLAQQGRIDEALAAFRRALELEPDYAAAHFNLGNALKQQGKSEEALAAYRRTVKLRPDHAAARVNIGVVLQERGRVEEAIAAYRQAVAVAPNYAHAHYNLGIALQSQELLSEALAAYQRAAELAPDLPELRVNLGVLLRELGRPNEALDALARAIALRPNYAEAHYNLAIVLHDQGRLEEATANYRQAIRFRPGYAEAYNNLGLLGQAQGRLEEAAAAFGQAIDANPGYAEAHNNLGLVRQEQGSLEEATASLRQALDLNPAYPEAHYNLGNVLRERGSLEAAIAAYRRALELRPDDISAFSQLFYQRCRACDWPDYASDQEMILDIVRGGCGEVPPFVLLATTANSSDQLRCARQWMAAVKPPPDAVFRHARPAEQRRIRLGYLSGDFHRHATAVLTAELFERHDRARFEVFSYSFGPDDGSPTRARLVRAFDRFVDVRQIPHAQAAQRIRDDGVNILIDLKGHTLGARPKILALRPAPIQVNYLGFPGTMGVDFMDYILVDPMVVPPDRQADYSEKIAYLPGCYQPSDSTREIATEVPSRSQSGLPARAFVFCCFNNSFKLTPVFFDIWMRLLRGVPGSVLWLLEGNALMRENLRREARARGVDPDRLVFAPVVPLPQHLARHVNADLFLDTLPCNAHTTASDALWAGLPVLTCVGDTFAGRVAASLLTAIGLPELVTDSLEMYEHRALELAGNSRKLSELKADLQLKRRTAALFDIAGFTRNIEAAYTRMWETWRAGEAPLSFRIEEPPGAAERGTTRTQAPVTDSPIAQA